MNDLKVFGLEFLNSFLPDATKLAMETALKNLEPKKDDKLNETEQKQLERLKNENDALRASNAAYLKAEKTNKNFLVLVILGWFSCGIGFGYFFPRPQPPRAVTFEIEAKGESPITSTLQEGNEAEVNGVKVKVK